MYRGKIAVISGGASGIGAATAQLLTQRGCKVFVLDSNLNVTQFKEIDYLHCDVSILEDVKQSIIHIEKSNGRIDYLFAAAGIHLHADVEETTLEKFDNLMKVNVYGTFYLVKEVIPIMKRNQTGSIVLMGSDQSLIAKPKNFAYAVTKGAIAQMTKGLAVDYAKHNIRVNCVCPGTIDTPMFRKAIKFKSNKYYKNVDLILKESNNAQPLQRIGTPEEVANVVAFLLSDDSSFMTGSLVSIDGGFTTL